MNVTIDLSTTLVITGVVITMFGFLTSRLVFRTSVSTADTNVGATVVLILAIVAGVVMMAMGAALWIEPNLRQMT